MTENDILRRIVRKVNRGFATLAAPRPKELNFWLVFRALAADALYPPVRRLRFSCWPGKVECMDEHYVRSARDSGRSLILTSFHSRYPHISLAWFRKANRELNWPIHAITSEANPRARNVRAYRTVFRSVLVTPRDLRQAVRALRSGETLVLLQDDVGQEGTPVRVFDRVACFRLGGARLAEMTDSLIVPYNALVHRRRGMIRWWPPIDPRDGNTQARLAQAMSTMIETYPYAWFGLATLLREGRLVHDSDSRPVE